MAWYSNYQSGTPWSGPDCANGGRCDYSIPLQRGTVITSPVNGIVLPNTTDYGGNSLPQQGMPWYAAYGRKRWGGEVDILTDYPSYGGLVVVDGLHFDTLGVRPGQTVHVGDVIGTSGGQTSGGNWPAQCCSTGPHIGWGARSFRGFTPVFNPLAILQDLVSGSDPSRVPTDGQLQAAGLGMLTSTGDLRRNLPPPNQTLQQSATGQAIASAGDPCSQFNDVDPRKWLCQLQQSVVNSAWGRWITQPIRLVKLVGGLICIGIAALLFVAPTALQVAGAASGQPELVAAGRVAGQIERGAVPHARFGDIAQRRAAINRRRNKPPSAPKAPPEPEGVFADGHRVGHMEDGRFVREPTEAG